MNNFKTSWKSTTRCHSWINKHFKNESKFIAKIANTVPLHYGQYKKACCLKSFPCNKDYLLSLKPLSFFGLNLYPQSHVRRATAIYEKEMHEYCLGKNKFINIVVLL